MTLKFAADRVIDRPLADIATDSNIDSTIIQEPPQESSPMAASFERDDDRRARIAERAYARFEARGNADGSDVDDWLIAEQEIDASPGGIE